VITSWSIGAGKEADMTEVLEGKTAIIYGGGGGIGGGVAQTFAREGARVFLVGRTREKLDAVAKEIASAGGLAEVAVVDALDEQAVDEHVRAVASEAGRVDVSFNLITRGDVQGTPPVDMTTNDLLRAVVTGLQSNFITARAAGAPDDRAGVRRDPPLEQRVGRRGDARYGQHRTGRRGHGGVHALPGGGGPDREGFASAAFGRRVLWRPCRTRRAPRSAGMTRRVHRRRWR
jgi:NAD(P)-dependent dehydrogenase (short-subunit alcohol dehydrogenase family)